MKFKAFGIDFEIEYLFVLVLAVGLFAENKRLIYLLLFSALHEMGHIVSLFLLGGKPCKITISYYGIGMQHNSNLSLKKEIIFLLSGIFVNLIFAVFGVQKEINLALAGINSVPVYPLDMGRVMKIFLDSLLPVSISYKFYFAIGWIFEISLIGISVYYKNFNLGLICIYLLFGLLRGNV